ncbi:MAG: hypothetical protein ABL931_05135 [Usitatibacteraceae bacterium]
MGDATEVAFHQAFSAVGTETPQKEGARLVQSIADAFSAYVGTNGKITFSPRSPGQRGLWLGVLQVCNHCNASVLNMKREVCARAGVDVRETFSIVTPQELAGLIRPRPHSSHPIDRERAVVLVEHAVARIGGTT